MKKFNVGALRQAADGATAAQKSTARDLVSKTLAQHGLLPSQGSQSGTAPISGLGGVEDLLGRFKPTGAGGSMTDVTLPEGASFVRETFSCAAGSRSYRVYRPSTAADGVTGVVMMLHGCTQTAEDFAIGTGMNALADAQGFVVVYPQQSRGENAQSCWNWFRRGDQRREMGEPAILSGIARKVAADTGAPAGRVFVAGLSAGAAMAVILGETYPDVFAAIGAHSGLGYATAKDVPSAFAAMAGTADLQATEARATDPVPTIVFHGTQDTTVHPSNAERIGRNVLERAGTQTIETEERGRKSGRDFQLRTSQTLEGGPLLEQWVVEGLGHAWGGGQSGGSYTDVSGPDASAEMIRFFFQVADQKCRDHDDKS